MPANSVTNSDLLSWIETSLEYENFQNYETTFSGKSEKGDGYVGDIVFVNVKGTTKSNSGKTLDLVIKHGKANDYLRRVSPVRAAFETEIHVYNEVLPTFLDFQRSKNVRNIFQSFPKCHGTLLMDHMEVIVLKDLKKAGYELHDKLKPFNLNHLKSVVTEYGKYHALSFALRDQQPETFASLNTNCTDVFKNFMEDESMVETVRKTIEDTEAMLRDENEVELLKKFQNSMTRDPIDVVVDLVTQEKSQVVISHGDCWNNNFMFKYEGDDRTTPSKLALLDFQLSYLRSPVFDLTYLLYATCSKEQLDKFEEIMEVYYSSLSSFLKELGSDPEKLFPYSALKTHWRKYSYFGVLFIQPMLKFVFCNKSDAPVLEDLQEGDSFGKLADIHLESRNKELYNERIKAVLRHHFESKF